MHEQKEQPNPMHIINPNLLINSQKKVNIYLRLTTKFGKKLLVYDKMRVREIMEIAQNQFSIAVDNQIIFYASQKFSLNDEHILHLHQGSILHLHYAQEYGFHQLQLTFQEVTDSGTTGSVVHYTVDSNKKICDFLFQKFQSAQLLLIESGRKIDNSQTFKAQEISNKATIYYILNQKELNHDEFQKDFNKLFEEQQQVQPGPKPQDKPEQLLAKTKSYRWRVIQDKKSKMKQRSSSEQMQNFDTKPNFKKKKSICLTAVKKNPEDPTYTWKRESSVSQSKNSRKLIKAIRGKKKQQGYSNKFQESSQNQIMTPNAKLKLRQEFRKLFNSQNLSLRPSQNKPTCLTKGQTFEFGKSDSKDRQIFESCQSQAVF